MKQVIVLREDHSDVHSVFETEGALLEWFREHLELMVDDSEVEKFRESVQDMLDVQKFFEDFQLDWDVSWVDFIK